MMISYAQNGEDVVLARALPWASGFYVDVGAADPARASVTKHFYDHGWHGINIDPRRDSIASLDQQRPRDINLRLAAGSTDGIITFFVSEEDPDLSTTDRHDLATLKAQGYHFVTEEVPVRRLDSILEEYGVSTIDFLKIDVEGSEADVLNGVDLARWRPRVVVVEATLPWSHKRRDQQWRHLLEEPGYVEGCFDGLNLFFAHKDDTEVHQRLAPASVLDSYEPASVVAMKTELESLRSYVRTLSGYTADADDRERSWILMANAPTRAFGAREPNIAVTRGLRPRNTWRRVAVVGSRHSGSELVSEALAKLIGACEIVIDHPADVDWTQLPENFVMLCRHPRTELLAQFLTREGIAVVATSRHPLEVLARLGAEYDVSRSDTGTPCALIDSETLVALATSPPAVDELAVSASWWAHPSTHRVRFEALRLQTMDTLNRLLSDLGTEPPPKIDGTSGQESLSLSLSSESVQVPDLSASQYWRIRDAHRLSFDLLGYSEKESRVDAAT